MTKSEAIKILTLANAAPFVPARPSGCGFAYVCLSYSVPKKDVAVIGKACADLGMKFSKGGHYGVTGPSIYIGYDNADGKALAKSEAFAKVLSDNGIAAYADGASD